MYLFENIQENFSEFHLGKLLGDVLVLISWTEIEKKEIGKDKEKPDKPYQPLFFVVQLHKKMIFSRGHFIFI